MTSPERFGHLQIPLEDIKSATNNFGDENLIGRGGFVKVYKGKLLRSGELINIAARRLPRTFGHVEVQFWTEISMLDCLKHENLVSMVGFCDEDGENIIVNKHEVHGSLDEYLSGPTLSWMQRLQICDGAARALSYIHYEEERNYGVIHRNIKSSKILLDNSWEAKISGFGLSIVNTTARKHHLLLSPVRGTFEYLDPVYRKTGGVTHKSDVYSFGIVLFEVLCGRKALIKEGREHQLLASFAKLHYEEGKLDEIINSDLRKQMDPQSLRIFSETAYDCLKEQRAQRPDMDVIVKRIKEALEFQRRLEHPLTPIEGTSSNHWKGRNLQHLKIPLEDIKLATEDFNEMYCIGSGGYGRVYKAELDHFDNMGELAKKRSTVAIKRILGRKDGQGEQGFLAEIEMLTSCKHRNIISLLGFCDEGPEMILVYEHAYKGSLDDYLGSTNYKTNLTWAQRLKMCLDIAYGLKYLHDSMEDKERIIHRDVKSANILLAQNWEAKIADFGLSKFHPANQEVSYLETKYIAGTEVYWDPEYAKTGKLKKESDVYSFGVVLLEILCGRLAYDPIYNVDNDKGLPSIARRRFSEGTLKEMIDPKIKEETDQNKFTLNRGPSEDSLDTFSKIAYQCLAETQAERPKMEEVISELEKALNFQVNRVDILKISLKDVILATENFSEKNLIGKGGFGKVYRGEVLHAGGCRTVTVKRWDEQYGQGEEEFLNELDILFEYKHENVIGLVGYCHEKGEMLIVYDYASHGSLDRYISDPSLTWIKRLKICIDAASGLNFLHGGVGSQERVIHRNIQSRNILLTSDWKAKITDFGIAKISPINEQMDYVIDKTRGPPTHIDPLYAITQFLTKESDIYSFGLVLFEVLCGRLETLSNPDGLGLRLTLDLQTFVRHHYEEGNLDEMVFQDIKEQIVPKSLSTFSKIAYQCIQFERERRPTMIDVIQQLNQALEFQEDYEIWKPKLPIDYQEIIQMSKSPKIYPTNSWKDLYDLFSKGILLQKGKVEKWVSSNDGVTNEMISATNFSYRNLRSLKWRSIRKSRFSKVAKMLDISNLNIQIKVKTQFLSPGKIYRAYLVFKFWEKKKVSNEPIYLSLRYQKAGKNKKTYFAEWKDDEWMMIQLDRFLNQKEDTEFEVLLKSFSRNYCGSYAIFVEGIEFQAIDKVEHEENEKREVMEKLLRSDSNMDQSQYLLSNHEEIIKRSESYVRNASKDELYFLLFKGISIDHGNKLFFISKVNGKRGHMLPAKAVLYDSSHVKSFNWRHLAESRFAEIGELLPNQVFRLKCHIETQMLSPSTTYGCYVVYKISEKSRGVEFPVKVRDQLPSSNKEIKIIYFRSPSPVISCKSKFVPEQREDGWMEVMVWEFIFSNECKDDHIPMDLKLVSFEGKMSGLIVSAIEFRPL